MTIMKGLAVVCLATMATCQPMASQTNDPLTNDLQEIVDLWNATITPLTEPNVMPNLESLATLRPSVRSAVNKIQKAQSKYGLVIQDPQTFSRIRRASVKNGKGEETTRQLSGFIQFFTSEDLKYVVNLITGLSDLYSLTFLWSSWDSALPNLSLFAQTREPAVSESSSDAQNATLKAWNDVYKAYEMLQVLSSTLNGNDENVPLRIKEKKLPQLSEHICERLQTLLIPLLSNEESTQAAQASISDPGDVDWIAQTRVVLSRCEQADDANSPPPTELMEGIDRAYRTFQQGQD